MAFVNYLARRVCNRGLHLRKRSALGFSNAGSKRNAGRICAEDGFLPRCAPEKLAKTDCMKKRKAEKKEPEKKKSMWENPDCCVEICVDVQPRYDDLYYKPSDKFRDFDQTWVECPQIKIAPKKICCYETLELPPLKKRTFKQRPKTAECVPDPNDSCVKKQTNKCPRVVLPGCKPVRNPPRCVAAAKSPSDCKKVCAPYPSFSECIHPPLNEGPPVECKCLSIPSVCEVFEYEKKMKGSKGGK